MRFSLALGKLAAACRQELDDLTGEAYLEALCYQFPIDDIEAFVRDANATGRYDFFPRLSDLRQDLIDARQSRAVIAGFLPTDTRTPEEKQADAIQTARRLREMVGAAPPEWPQPAKADQPAVSIPVVVTEERIEFLRRQAREWLPNGPIDPPRPPDHNPKG